MEHLSKKARTTEHPVDDGRDLAPSSPPPRVLLLGEGDFSFAKAYNAAYPTHELVATSFDSVELLKCKYGWSASHHLKRLEKENVTILHGVDATRLDEHALRKQHAPFDEVRFNFPLDDTKDSEENPKLLEGLFRTVAPLLKPQGRVTLGIVDHRFYDRTYDDLKPSRSHGFKIVSRRIWDREGRYQAAGYSHQTTTGTKKSTLDSYHTIEVSFVQDPTVDRDDEFLHSSDLSEDEGRLDSSEIKKRPAQNQIPVTYKDWRRQQFFKKYLEAPDQPRSLSDNAREQLKILLEKGEVDESGYQVIEKLIGGNVEFQSEKTNALFLRECERVSEDLSGKQYRAAKNRLKRLSTCFAQRRGKQGPSPLHLPFCIYLKVLASERLASDPNSNSAEADDLGEAPESFRLFLNRLRLFADGTYDKHDKPPMMWRSEQEKGITLICRIADPSTEIRDANSYEARTQMRDVLEREYGTFHLSHLKRFADQC